MSGRILERGEIEASANIPPFLNPATASLFQRRAERFKILAQGHPLSGYLLLMAQLCEAQDRALAALPALPRPDQRALDLSHEHHMPPLAFEALVRGDDWLPALDKLLEQFSTPDNPAVAAALQQLSRADSGQRKAWAVSLLSGQFDLLPAAVVPFLGAGLQVAFSHWLLALPEGTLSERESCTQCPACGSPPVAGMIRHRGKQIGLRYLTCSLCSCEWHYVRVKCSHCEESKQLAYLSRQRDDAKPETAPIRAEVCPNCQGYLKHFYLEYDSEAEAMADDIASLDLDMMVNEAGYMRRAPNLLLAPGAE
ncbi:formate dehydrogenase accessory protein FdhE [Pseudomonas sp. NPDC078700]|uniref:formate dehydrogenase accessory protein FdhE n=1 Tax=Pseudomonas sp. NPDC078700 TaxID=3364424 RepID=UPI0037C4F768